MNERREVPLNDYDKVNRQKQCLPATWPKAADGLSEFLSKSDALFDSELNYKLSIAGRVGSIIHVALARGPACRATINLRISPVEITSGKLDPIDCVEIRSCEVSWSSARGTVSEGLVAAKLCREAVELAAEIETNFCGLYPLE